MSDLEIEIIDNESLIEFDLKLYCATVGNSQNDSNDNLTDCDSH